MRLQYCPEEFAGSVFVCDNGIGELLDASGINVWINGPRPAWIKLLRSRRHDFVAHQSSAPVGSDETV